MFHNNIVFKIDPPVISTAYGLNRTNYGSNVLDKERNSVTVMKTTAR